MIDERVGRAKECPSHEEHEEYRLCDGKSAPLADDKASQIVAVSVCEIRGRGGEQQHEGDGSGLRGGDMRQPENPEEVRDEQNAKRFAEGKAPIGKSGEKAKGKRKSRQSDNLYGDKPLKGVEHDGGLYYGRDWGCRGLDWLRKVLV